MIATHFISLIRAGLGNSIYGEGMPWGTGMPENYFQD
jgi:hypothetical protein